MARKPRRKASLHSAGKVTEADLLARARALADDPTLAMPICEGSCVFFSPVAAARKAIVKVHAAREDDAKLSRLARSGNELARAYAATLLVARAQKLPYVAELRMAGESIPYVMRGKAKPFYLAGLQHYDDRALRLLSVASWTRKRGLHFFSADRGIICTGRSARPPADFVGEEAAVLGLSPAGPGRYACEHGGRASGDAIILTWRDANATFEQCAECSGEDSLARQLFRHMAGPKLAAGFSVEVVLAPLEAVAGEAVSSDAPLDKTTTSAYISGALSDAGLLAAGHASRKETLRSSGRIVYVAGERSYGDDREAFLDALTATGDERRALDAALAKHDAPVILEKPTVARAIAELWDVHGRVMLEAAAQDTETAARLHKASVSVEEAADLVRRAAREGASRSVLAALPAYGRLPPVAGLADQAARAFRAQGRDAAVRFVQDRAAGVASRGVALAILLELDAAKGQEWRFGHVDHENAPALAGPVKTLLRGAPAEYHGALTLVSRFAGETMSFDPK